jgi:GTP-binding protein
VVFLLDVRRIPSAHDLALQGWLENRAIPACFVVTKTDKISRGGRGFHFRQIAEAFGLPQEDLVPFSAVTREGGPFIWGRIIRAVEGKG